MSDEQHQQAIGRTVEEYADSKKKLATLQGEVIKIEASNGSSPASAHEHDDEQLS
jgi:hypothetical protein